MLFKKLRNNGSPGNLTLAESIYCFPMGLILWPLVLNLDKLLRYSRYFSCVFYCTRDTNSLIYFGTFTLILDLEPLNLFKKIKHSPVSSNFFSFVSF